MATQYTRQRYSARPVPVLPPGITDPRSPGFQTWFAQYQAWVAAEFQAVQRGIPFIEAVDLRDFASGIDPKGNNDSTSGFNQAINEGFGHISARHNADSIAGSYPELNRQLFIPAGVYTVTDSLNFSAISGCVIRGEGMRVSRIRMEGNHNKPIIKGNYLSYADLSDFSIEIFNNATTTDVAAVEIDADGTFPNALKPQQISWRRVNFNGNQLGRIALRYAYSGGTAQCDTIVHDNCLCGDWTDAGYALGRPSFGANNGVGIIWLGGDIQGCTHDGIASWSGQPIIYGTSFQNQSFDRPRQIESNGYDIHIYSAPARSASARDCTSESDCFAFGVGLIDNCMTQAGNVGTDSAGWQPSTAFAQGDLKRGSAGDATRSDGRAWRCHTAGTTSGTEPIWSAQASAYYQLDANITIGTKALTGTNFNASMPTMGLMVSDAQGTWFDSIASYSTSTSLTTTNNAPRTFVNASIWIGAFVLDGTAKWMHQEFDAVRGAAMIIKNNCKFNFGRIYNDTKPLHLDIRSSRLDWQQPLKTYAQDAEGDFEDVSEVSATVGLGDIFLSTIKAPFIAKPAGSSGTAGLYRKFKALLHPLLFPGGYGNVPYNDVGACRGDGDDAVNGSETDIRRNVLAIIGTLGKQAKVSGTDQGGDDFNLQCAIGTGAAPSKSINRRINVPTTTGTTKQTASVVGQTTYDTWGGLEAITGRTWTQGLGTKIEPKTTNYTAVPSDKTILVDATGGNKTVTLTSAASCYNSTTKVGVVLTIIKSDSSVNTVTIDANASETINGSLTVVLSTQYATKTIQSDGSNWWVL